MTLLFSLTGTPKADLSPKSLTQISPIKNLSNQLPAPAPGPAPPLTGVGLQEHLCLPQDFLCPVLGAVCPGQKVLKVGIELGLLGLAEFLFCELYEEDSEGRSEDCPCPTLPHSWNPGPNGQETCSAPNLLCNPDQVWTLLWASVCPSVK